MISSEDHLPIDRIKLSKSLKVEVQKILLRGQDYFTKANIEAVTGKVGNPSFLSRRDLRVHN